MSDKPPTLSEEQSTVMQYIMDGQSVLVTGSAGTGKSTLLRELAARFYQLPITASTGIAAVGVGGMTIHSWAGIGLAQDPAEQIADKIIENHGKAYKRILKASKLAIDEVSMIHGELFDLLDVVFKKVRRSEKPFGGIQLILFGDFLQLPPVSKDTPQQFAFQSRAWKEAGIRVTILTQVFRQADRAFSSALNQIRVGELSDETLALLRSRFQAADPDPSIAPVTVYTHNEDVERLNARELAKIQAEEREWEARDWGEGGALATLQKNCLAPAILKLRPGAQVMLLWNIDTESGLANGSIGVVDSFNVHTRMPVVRFTNGLKREIEKVSWEIKIGGAVLASRTQIPLRLAWAITSHKSQGLTLDKIRVHLDRAFEYGQAYVALSRARTLEGLFIESTKANCIKAHPAAVAFYEQCGQLGPLKRDGELF